ncbi:unnamed protein product, partial [marine sediment metagenome]
YFLNTKSYHYWSSTIYQYYAITRAKTVNFADGHISSGDLFDNPLWSDLYYVRCVRSEQ